MVVLTSFTQPTDGIRHRQSNTTVYVNDNILGKGTLYIAESRLSWVSDSGNGFSIEYPHISLHAISRDLSAFPQECLFLMLDTALGDEETNNGDRESDDGNENDSDSEETTEIRLVPDDRGMLEAMFHAMNACQALHPDPEDSFSDEDFFEDADDEIPMEEADNRMAGLRIENMDGRLYSRRAVELEDMEEDMEEEDMVRDIPGHTSGILGGRVLGRVGGMAGDTAGDTSRTLGGRVGGMAGDMAGYTSRTLGDRVEGRVGGRVVGGMVVDMAGDTVGDTSRTLGGRVVVGMAGDMAEDTAEGTAGGTAGDTSDTLEGRVVVVGEEGAGMAAVRERGMVPHDRSFLSGSNQHRCRRAQLPPADPLHMELERSHFDDAEN